MLLIKMKMVKVELVLERVLGMELGLVKVLEVLVVPVEVEQVALVVLEAQEEIGIDWSQDTYDAGLHLNVYGAEKLASYFGKILAEECGVADHRGDAQLSQVWAEKVKIYNARKEALLAQS